MKKRDSLHTYYTILCALLYALVMGACTLHYTEGHAQVYRICCRVTERDAETVRCPRDQETQELIEAEDPQEGCGLSAVCGQPDDCVDCYDPECQCCYEPGYPCYWNYNKYPWY